MTPQELRNRTKAFALAILRLTRRLPKTDEGRVIARQLMRSGISVGANYRAVCRARSDAEFVAKLGTVIEECDETLFWLELLTEASICALSRLKSELAEGNELLRIFAASRETVRRRLRHAKSKSQNHKSQISNHKS